MHEPHGVRFNKEPMSALTHFVGFVLALGGLGALLAWCGTDGPTVASVAIYGGTLVALFLASTVYHFVDLGERGNDWLKRVDHAAIFLFIAGTYVPTLLHLLDGAWRVAMLAVIGGLGVSGAVFKLAWFECPPWLSTTLYLVLGWMAVIPAHLIFPQLSAGALAWLIGGGLAYTVGALVFATEWPDPLPKRFGHHEVWHLFVLAGAGAHFAFVAGLLEHPRPV